MLTTLRYLLLLNIIWLCQVYGKSTIDNVYINQNEQSLLVSVDSTIDFSPAVTEAIHSGLTLTLQYQFKLNIDKWYQIMPLATLNKTYHIAYYRVTNQYIINDPVTFDTLEYKSLFEVKQFFQRLQNFPLIPISQLPEQTLELSVRFHLTSDNLPSYISIERYFDNDWDIDSDWSDWPLP